MARSTVTATIPAGQSISSSIDLSEGTAVFFHAPAEWTPAVLTFQVSHDNITFGDLVDINAHETVINIMSGTVLRVDLLPSNVGWLKFRSGSRSSPVIQEADRTFTITIDI
jgi:hypothetical protein